MPITPALPVSSLSMGERRRIYFKISVPDVTDERMCTRALSSYPWTTVVLLSEPRSLTFPTNAVSDSTREGSSSSVSCFSLEVFDAFYFATSFFLSSSESFDNLLPVEVSEFSPSVASTTFFYVYFPTE